MKRRAGYLCSAVGILVLFAVLLLMQTSVPAWGTVRLTDILMIIGGLMFIVPLYVDSVRRKSNDNARNRWIWQTLPPIGMAVVCIGILIPNSVGFFSLFPLADLFYLIGCLMILPVFAYPAFDVDHEIEEDIEEEIERR